MDNKCLWIIKTKKIEKRKKISIKREDDLYIFIRNNNNNITSSFQNNSFLILSFLL